MPELTSTFANSAVPAGRRARDARDRPDRSQAPTLEPTTADKSPTVAAMESELNSHRAKDADPKVEEAIKFTWKEFERGKISRDALIRTLRQLGVPLDQIRAHLDG